MRFLILSAAFSCGCACGHEINLEVTSLCSSIRVSYRAIPMRTLTPPANLDEYALPTMPMEGEEPDHEPPSTEDEESIWYSSEADADRWAARHEATP